MSTFSLKIIASDKVFFDGRAEMITIPAPDGEKCILAHHANMVIATDLGDARFRTEDGELHHVVIGQGFVEAINNRVLMIVDSAERPEDIDAKRAQDALERAQEQLRQKQSIQEYHHTQASMARAMTRLKVTSRLGM